MGLFICAKCNCIENTALGHYWSKDVVSLNLPDDMKEFESGKPLCSECIPADATFKGSESGPRISHGKWHGKFPKVDAEVFLASEEGKSYARSGEYGLTYIK